MATEAGGNVNTIGFFVDMAVLFRRTLIQVDTNEPKLNIPKRQKAPHEIRHEVIIEALNLAIEADAGWFIRPGLRQDDFEAAITAPVETTRIDRHRKFVRPRPWQGAAK